MGLPDFAPRFETDAVRPYYEGLEQGELRATACPVCGTFYWYPPEILPCHPSHEPEWRAVSPVGDVYSFTTIERSLLPGADAHSVPHTIIMMHPDDAPGVRIIGLLDGDDASSIACGSRVRLSPIRIGEHIVPGFVPVTAD